MRLGQLKLCKYTLYAVGILLVFFLQTTPNLMPKIFGVTPMLLVASAISISILEDEIPGLFLGLFAGIMMDLSVGVQIGFYAIMLAFLCCIVKVFVVKRLKISLSTSMIISSGTLFIVIILSWWLRFSEYSAPFIILIDIFIPIFVYTVLCLPILYLINFGIYTAFSTSAK